VYIFSEVPLPATLEVWKPCAVYLFHRDHELPVLRKNSDAIWELCLGLVQRLHQKSGIIEELAFSSIAGRLARLLLDQFAGRDDSYIGSNQSLDEMGAIIGTIPVMVCKQIYQFAENGMINVSRTEFQLTDQVGLEKIAGLK